MTLQILKRREGIIPELIFGNNVDRRDYVIHKTSKLRNKVYNYYRRVTGTYGGVEGFLTVRVRRAERDPKDPSQPLKDEFGNIVYKRGWRFIERNKHNLLTTNGRDWVHAQLLTNTTAGTQGANEVALTDDATGANAADDTLPGELDNTNGLGKKGADGGITHTDDTNTTTFVVSWTASGAGDTNIQMAGTFFVPTAATGQLVFENTFTSTDLASGDTLELTWTFTIG